MWMLARLLRFLIRSGTLIVTGPDGKRHSFGDGSPDRRAVIRLTSEAAAWRIALNPNLAAGEAYMDGTLVLEDGTDILDLLDLIMFNGRWEIGNPVRGALGKRNRGRFLTPLKQWNDRRRARRNVAHHYDLSRALYELFLDEDMQYSCAYFMPGVTDLDSAQRDKKLHIARKLDLRAGQKVLDIGCGWGGMARTLAQLADVHVTGITLSKEQLAVAEERSRAAGLADRTTFRIEDYRETSGPFDRIVSVGMFEHVGRPFYRTFFNQCAELLADDGVMLLHTIGRLRPPGTTGGFTAKYIFPGGYSPALSEVMAAIEQTGLIVTDVEVLRYHYARTIEHWYRRTVENRDKIEALYDARFWRMWMFYLAGAICAFRHSALVNFQIQITKRVSTLPITRNYMMDPEPVQPAVRAAE